MWETSSVSEFIAHELPTNFLAVAQVSYFYYIPVKYRKTHSSRNRRQKHARVRATREQLLTFEVHLEYFISGMGVWLGKLFWLTWQVENTGREWLERYGGRRDLETLKSRLKRKLKNQIEKCKISALSFFCIFEFLTPPEIFECVWSIAR